MATVTLRRGDIFPVGTTVGIYPAGSVNPNTNTPGGAAIASAAVDAAGLLTVTDAGISSLTSYVAHAIVGSTPQTVRVRSTLDNEDRGTATGTWTTSSGSTAITAATVSAGALAVGQRVVGTGIVGGTRLIAGSGAAWTLSSPASASGVGVAFYADGARVPVVRLGATAVPQPHSTQQARNAQRRATVGTS